MTGSVGYGPLRPDWRLHGQAGQFQGSDAGSQGDSFQGGLNVPDQQQGAEGYRRRCQGIPGSSFRCHRLALTIFIRQKPYEKHSE